MHRSRVALVVAGITLAVPVPYSGSGFPEGQAIDGCTLDWEGVAPLTMAANEAARDRPPPFRYQEVSDLVCKIAE
jgi:hypothetical protein